MLKNKMRSGVVTTEVAVGIALAVIVVLVAIGLFSTNISDMLTNSNLSNIFNGNASKEHYDNFNRNYSQSQIDVQIMGEQGLEMLRRKANNKALDLIPNSSDKTTANGVAYLSLAIKALVGESDACVQMKKDSDKFCDEDSIGGYNYTINTSGALTVTKVNMAGTESTADPIKNPLDSAVVGIISSSTVPLDADGRSSFTTDKKYEFIKEISTKFEPYVDPSVLLIKPTTTFTNTTTEPPPSSKNPPLKTALTDLLGSLKSSVNSAYNGCADGIVPKYGESCCNGTTIPAIVIFGITIVPAIHIMFGDMGHDCWVGPSENKAFSSWADHTKEQINKSNKTGIDLINIILNTSNIYVNSGANNDESYTHLMSHDHYNSTTSCDVLKNGLRDIASKYSLDISIPECNPASWTTDY